jgi:hypothetical protein
MEERYDIYEEGVKINENPVSLERAERWKRQCDMYPPIKCEIVEVKE